jgi:Tol biopolymer transport system component
MRKAFFESWSSTGLIAFTTNAGWIGTMTPTGRHVRRLTPRGVITRDPDWSPDGRHLVWARLRKHPAESFSILVMDRRGRHVRPLTGPHPFPEDLLQDTGPTYSPNGERIVFNRCCFGTRNTHTNEIFVMHADGSHLRRLTHNRAEDYASSWQPR